MLVPATYAWSETTFQILQTFGILLSVTKMILFALIINSVGSVNNIGQVRGACSGLLTDVAEVWAAGLHALILHLAPWLTLPLPLPPLLLLPMLPLLPLQVLALVLVAMLHLIYLRICLPFRMRIELAAGEPLPVPLPCCPPPRRLLFFSPLPPWKRSF